MSRYLLAVLAVAGCAEEHSCPLIQEFNGFMLVLEDDAWEPALLAIEVSYQDDLGEQAYRCDVSVPAPANDAGVDGYANCTSSTPDNGIHPYVEAGKALVVTFEATPARVHLRVRDQSRLVLERDVELRYETRYRFGKHCQGSSTAEARIGLSGS